MRCNHVTGFGGDDLSGALAAKADLLAFAARIGLLIAHGYGTRVYATEWRFDADLSGGCDVPLAETPRAVDGAHRPTFGFSSRI